MEDKLDRNDIADIIGLSPLQKGMLFHYLENPYSEAYVEKVCVKLKGKIQNTAFETSWQAVTDAHDTLKTVFRWEKIQNPVQIILKQKKLNLKIYDLDSQASFHSQERMMQSQQINLQETPFALVLMKGTTEHHLWLIYTHILLDGWSISLLIKEFLENYENLVQGYPLAESNKPKFKSYIKYLQTCSIDSQEQYWKSLLECLPIRTNLFPDHPYYTNEVEYKWICKQIDKDLHVKMIDFAKNQQVSIAILFYLAWSILIHKYSDAEDITFGISVSLRHLPIPNVDQIVGLLINTIPLRLKINAESKVENLLKSLQDQFIKSQSYASLPLPEIKRVSGLSNREELFDSLVVVENYPIYNSLLEDGEQLNVSGFSNKEFTHYPLTMIVDLLNNANVKFSYDLKRYSEDYISQIIHHFFVILGQIVEQGSQEVKDIHLLSPLEAKELIKRFNSTENAYPHEATVIDLFKEQVQQHAHKVAVIGDVHQMTFLELDRQSDQLAQQMLQKQILPGEKIGVMLPKDIGMVIALLAILKVKAAYVPLNPRLPKARKDYYIEDCQVRYLITQQVDGSLIIQPTANEEVNLSDDKEDIASDSPLAYVLYSSGSTGQPKGIMIPHKGIIRLVKNTNFISFDSQDCFLSTCPLDFDVSVLEIWGCLLNGATLVLVDETFLLMPDKIKKVLNKNSVNKLWLSTPLFNAWVNADLSLLQNLEYVIVGGDILSPSHMSKVKKAYPYLKLVNGYGPTENTVLSTTFEIKDEPYMRIPIGQPIANSTAYIVDSLGHIQPIGAMGEIWLGGEGVARGYQNKKELSQDRFIDNPFGKGRLYKSGDMGRWLPDGSIDFFGRKDFQVKVRGYRIETAEVERALKSFSSISEAIVTAEELENQEKELVAYIQKKAEFSLAELKQFLSSLIPHYCIPTLFVPIVSFPYTSTGKIDRQELTKLRKKALQDVQGTHLPVTELEKNVTRIYEKVLQRSSISLYDNFFDLGGNSLHTIQIRSLIQKELQIEIPVTDIFQFPTVTSLSKHLQEKIIANPNQINTNTVKEDSDKHFPSEKDMAVIGLCCKFPGSETISEFWHNLVEERDMIQRFSQAELVEQGIPREAFDKPNYISAKGSLKDIEHFDHHFFGYTEREAEMMDPQLRLLHECCWNVLEDAGYVPETYKGKIGLFVGSEVNVLWIKSLLNQLRDPTELWQASHYTIHSMSTSISYKLKLTGPSLTIDTACSSSLVAVHEAKQSILCGECDMAIAGGVSIELPKKAGYLYEEGMILSKTGECRAFDANATGTVSGDGIGLVLLKPLQKAIADQDHIYAVLKGSAINNDGDRKVGFTAPSVDGQAEVVKRALEDAHVSPQSISYIETHGTATKLGDPIEIKALSQVYTSQKAPIRIGSVKTNIGHLNTAAGIAGFIKTALALRYHYIPASLHFEKENPDCHFSQTSLQVISKGERWPITSRCLAGVSSFGIGGTNAHAILEDFSFIGKQSNMKEEAHLLLFSAKSKPALEKRIQAFKAAMSQSELALEDICYTLQVGRQHFEYRSALICQTKEEGQRMLNESPLIHSVPHHYRPMMAFVFPGQGAQSLQISRYLYDRYSTVKKYMDLGLSKIKSHYGLDLTPLLFVQSDQQRLSDELLNQTHYLQVITFIYSYSLSLLLQELEVLPQAMIGHSVGEYVAACLAGVFTFEEGLELLIERGKLMNSLKEGRMVAVRAPQEMISCLLDKHFNLSIAAINSPCDFVISGDPVSIDSLMQSAKDQDIPVFLLNTSKAFHSKDMESIRNNLQQLFSTVQFQKPKNSYVSSLTGELINPDEVITSQYWTDHACKTVQFSKGIQNLLAIGINLFVELGPVKALTALIKRQMSTEKGDQVISNVIHASECCSESEAFLRLIQQLWLKGVNCDWKSLYQESRKRVSLPGYPFDRYYFWKYGQPHLFLKEPIHDGLTRPQSNRLNQFTSSWQPITQTLSKVQSKSLWLIHQDTRLDRLLLNYYQTRSHFVDFDFSKAKDLSSFVAWFQMYRQSVQEPLQIIYTLCYEDIIPNKRETTVDDFNLKINCYFSPLLKLIQMLGEEKTSSPIDLRVIGNQAISTHDGESVNPTKSTLVAFLRAVQVEYPNLATQFIDLGKADSSNNDLFKIIESHVDVKINSEIALRQNQGILGLSYHKINESKSEQELLLKQGGVYCITGGLGGIGLVVAEFLAVNYEARLILLGRSSLQDVENRIHNDASLRDKLQNIKSYARSLDIVKLDMGDREATQRVFAEIYQKYESIEGFIHLAACADEGLIQTKKLTDFQRVFYPKIMGSINLINTITKFSAPNFIILASSIASVNGDLGQSAYVMANHFLNAYAKQCKIDLGLPVMSVNWDTWREVGMAKKYVDETDLSIHPEPYYSAVYTFSRENDWLLDEHTIGENALFVGTGYISLLHRCFYQLGIPYPLTITSIQFARPLIVKERQSLNLKISVFNVAENEFQFSFSQITFDQDELLLCEGNLYADSSIYLVPTLNIAERTSTFAHSLVFPVDQSIKKQDKGIRFGPRWNNVRKVYYSQNEGIAIIQLEKNYLKDQETYLIHPAMLDNASSFLLDVHYPGLSILPIAYKNLKIYRPFTSHIYCYAQLEWGNHKTLSIHLQIFDTSQLCCLECEIIFKEVDQITSANSNYALQLDKIGDFSTLRYHLCSNNLLEVDEVEFETVSTGLNFKEVLYALGVIPNLSNESVLKFGLEAAGVITKTGSGVTKFKVGDPVMGLVTGGFNKFVQAKANHLILKPAHLTFEEAASIPVAYLTAYYSLVKRANLQPGEKLLIHSATGGVGLAAIEIAKSIGAEVYATASTAEKQEYLHQLGVKGVFHSRQSDFAERIMASTGGYGVDVVLSSSSGETLKQSLAIVAPYGRFLEMGVKDILENSSLEMNNFKKGISFTSISISPCMPNYIQLLQEVVSNIENQHWQPIPIIPFDLANTQQAFELLASSKHIGKVVVLHYPLHHLSKLNVKYSKMGKQYEALSNEEGISSLLMGIKFASTKSQCLTEAFVTKKNQIIQGRQHAFKGQAHSSKNKRKRPSLSTNYVPPCNTIESTLVGLLEEFLGMEGIGIHDNFFDLGLTSLDVIQIKSSVNKHFNVDVPVVQFYSYPTVAKLSQWMQSQGLGNLILTSHAEKEGRS